MARVTTNKKPLGIRSRKKKGLYSATRRLIGKSKKLKKKWKNLVSEQTIQQKIITEQRQNKERQETPDRTKGDMGQRKAATQRKERDTRLPAERVGKAEWTGKEMGQNLQQLVDNLAGTAGMVRPKRRRAQWSKETAVEEKAASLAETNKLKDELLNEMENFQKSIMAKSDEISRGVRVEKEAHRKVLQNRKDLDTKFSNQAVALKKSIVGQQEELRKHLTLKSEELRKLVDQNLNKIKRETAVAKEEIKKQFQELNRLQMKTLKSFQEKPSFPVKEIAAEILETAVGQLELEPLEAVEEPKKRKLSDITIGEVSKTKEPPDMIVDETSKTRKPSDTSVSEVSEKRESSDISAGEILEIEELSEGELEGAKLEEGEHLEEQPITEMKLTEEEGLVEKGDVEEPQKEILVSPEKTKEHVAKKPKQELKDWTKILDTQKGPVCMFCKTGGEELYKVCKCIGIYSTAHMECLAEVCQRRKQMSSVRCGTNFPLHKGPEFYLVCRQAKEVEEPPKPPLPLSHFVAIAIFTTTLVISNALAKAYKKDHIVLYVLEKVTAFFFTVCLVVLIFALLEMSIMDLLRRLKEAMPALHRIFRKSGNATVDSMEQKEIQVKADIAKHSDNVNVGKKRSRSRTQKPRNERSRSRTKKSKNESRQQS